MKNTAIALLALPILVGMPAKGLEMSTSEKVGVSFRAGNLVGIIETLCLLYDKNVIDYYTTSGAIAAAISNKGLDDHAKRMGLAFLNKETSFGRTNKDCKRLLDSYR